MPTETIVRRVGSFVSHITTFVYCVSYNPTGITFATIMARKSILVVDDEKNQREILETILSGEGYDVTTASSGEAAMKFVESRRFDLVLTDLKMTGMSGLDLLKELTNFDKSIIVILLTAHGSVDSAVDAMRLGCVRVSAETLRQRETARNGLACVKETLDARRRDNLRLTRDGQGQKADLEDRQIQLNCPNPRRKRNGKGTDRTFDPYEQPACERGLSGSELCRDQ